MNKQELISDKLRKRFGEKDIFSSQELYEFMQIYYTSLKKSTFFWRVYELRKNNMIYQIKKGYYKLQSKETYYPVIKSDIKKIRDKIAHYFPYIDFCIWESSWLNEFSRHQVSKNIIFIEVDKELTQSVFYKVSEDIKNVYLTPDKSVYNLYVSENINSIIVKPLITKSPLQTINDTPTVKLEKILVDLFCNEIYLIPYISNEMVTIFDTALKKYEVNYSTLFNYSRRREKEVKLKEFLISHFDYVRKIL